LAVVGTVSKYRNGPTGATAATFPTTLSNAPVAYYNVTNGAVEAVAVF